MNQNSKNKIPNKNNGITLIAFVVSTKCLQYN